MKKQKKIKLLAIIITISIVLAALLTYYQLTKEQKEFHIHADFKVYLNGEFINFTQDRFQSTQETIHHEYVHLHDNNGDVIHYHKEGFTLSNFFQSLNMSYTNECFTDEQNNKYCTNQTHTLKTFVNGKKIQNGPEYISEDLDQILIIHSENNQNIQEIIDQVTDKACIESAKCPWRGSPSEGSCVSGSACKVDLSKLE